MFREFTKNPNFASTEKEILTLWDKEQVFQKSVSQPAPKGDFIFFDGPPFATGLPHYGHLLAGTIKDIIPRYWTMKGYHVDRRFGWDCHGLPIESLIQNELKLDGNAEIQKYGVGNFNEACRSSVLRYTSEWEHTVTRMGRFVDFKNDYKTMDSNFMESVWWVFKRCFDLGLIYQGHRIQPYSPALGTPLSNFETNQGYKDRQDPSITIALKLENTDEHLLVWTTTPWTLPSNLAVALGATIEYVLVEKDNKKYWIARERAASFFGADVSILTSKTGKELAGRKYAPIFTYTPNLSPKQYTILLADFVSTTDGTGAVHIAPSFGEEDFELGKNEGLGLWDPLDDSGRFTSLVPTWQGIGAKEADKAIIQALKEKGILFHQSTIMHSYPHCYRTDVPLLYRALKTWFLRLDAPVTSQEGVTKTLKQWMIDCNQQIHWVPDHIKDGRFGKWLEGARDWNLSRNRFWGTPIPVWIADDGDMLCIGSIEELEKLTGEKVTDLHKHIVDILEVRTSDKKVFDPSGKVYRRTPEVLDCWFESGSMPYAQNHYPFENKAKFESSFPADFIAEGLDQTRGWFYTLTVLSAALFQKPAFKNVVINGIILAEDGQKMSKRLRNYPDPNELIDQTCADAVRIFMIHSAAVKAGDLRFSETGVREMVRSILLPLWNSLSLLVTYANADARKGQLTWKPGQDIVSTHELDRWIISELQNLLARVKAGMEDFHLYTVVPAILEYIDHLTNWYIRRSRRRFWKSENDRDKNEAYATLYKVMVEFSKVLAPFLPFLSEFMYQILVREVDTSAPISVHLCRFPEPETSLIDTSLVERMSLAHEAVMLGRSLRANANIKNRQPLHKLQIAVHSASEKENIQAVELLIRDELNVKEVVVTTDETELVKYSAKANFKTLGKRMGKDMKAVAEQVAALSHAQIADVLAGKTLTLPQGELTTEDLLVVRNVSEGLTVEAGTRLTVALETTVTPELYREGLARECINRIQNLRKDSDFEVTDHIHLQVGCEGDELKQAFTEHQNSICAEVLASKVDLQDDCFDSIAEVKVPEGRIVFKILGRV